MTSQYNSWPQINLETGHGENIHRFVNPKDFDTPFEHHIAYLLKKLWLKYHINPSVICYNKKRKYLYILTIIDLETMNNAAYQTL